MVAPITGKWWMLIIGIGMVLWAVVQILHGDIPAWIWVLWAIVGGLLLITNR